MLIRFPAYSADSASALAPPRLSLDKTHTAELLLAFYCALCGISITVRARSNIRAVGLWRTCRRIFNSRRYICVRSCQFSALTRKCLWGYCSRWYWVRAYKWRFVKCYVWGPHTRHLKMCRFGFGVFGRRGGGVVFFARNSIGIRILIYDLMGNWFCTWMVYKETGLVMAVEAVW